MVKAYAALRQLLLGRWMNGKKDPEIFTDVSQDLRNRDKAGRAVNIRWPVKRHQSLLAVKIEPGMNCGPNPLCGGQMAYQGVDHHIADKVFFFMGDAFPQQIPVSVGRGCR